jgi:hypothetical protein
LRRRDNRLRLPNLRLRQRDNRARLSANRVRRSGNPPYRFLNRPARRVDLSCGQVNRFAQRHPGLCVAPNHWAAVRSGQQSRIFSGASQQELRELLNRQIWQITWVDLDHRQRPQLTM